MTHARKELISLDSTPYYHCISRCVRRAFLWGEDSFTGKNFEHRKGWVTGRLRELADTFAIDIAAYAVMSNHYHLVLRVDRQKASNWSTNEVIDRWKRLYKLPQTVVRYQRNETLLEAERMRVNQYVETWRERLFDISWFMRCLNEHLARRANEEDNCSGRFWEGRFKSQALLDEAAVLTAMSYVDLNPIRAAMADTPESSDFTSIAQRIAELNAIDEPVSSTDTKTNTLCGPGLMGLAPQHEDPHPNAMGFSLTDYLELVDWSGRAIRNDKRGFIDQEIPPILTRIGLEPGGFINHLRGRKGRPHSRVLGSIEKMRQAAVEMGRSFIKGLSEARALYLKPSG